MRLLKASFAETEEGFRVVAVTNTGSVIVIDGQGEPPTDLDDVQAMANAEPQALTGKEL